MNAVLFHGPGLPLELQFREPPPLQDAEILVHVSCCTLCRSDLHTHAGRRAEPTPCVLGHEMIGTIGAFGPNATREDVNGVPLQPGTQVAWAVAVPCRQCFFCQQDLPQKCERLLKYGHQAANVERFMGGGLCEFVILRPGTSLYVVPPCLADPVAALANCAIATVAGMFRLGSVASGQCVAVIGAGILGVTACAMGAAAGATVIASDPLPQCREQARRFGATMACEPGELRDMLLQHTHSRGADVVLELAGTAASVQAALSLARIGGTVLLGGTVAPVGSIELDPEQCTRRMLTIRGVHNYHPKDLGTALNFLAGPGSKFPWHELIAAEFPLAQAEAAFHAAHQLPGRRVAVRP